LTRTARTRRLYVRAPRRRAATAPERSGQTRRQVPA